MFFKKIGFGGNFIDWIKTFLCKQESCGLNEGFTIKYFNLQKGPRQGDPFSAYLLILALEILLLIKNDFSIKSIKILEYVFLYTSYVNIQCFSSKI